MENRREKTISHLLLHWVPGGEGAAPLSPAQPPPALMLRRLRQGQPAEVGFQGGLYPLTRSLGTGRDRAPGNRHRPHMQQGWGRRGGGGRGNLESAQTPEF